MSRHGYSEDCDDDLAFGRWQGQLKSAIRGKRGQAFLRELVEALDAMPEKRLIRHELRKDGEVCAIGALGAKRGINLESLDIEDYESLGKAFDVAYQLVCEIEYRNDDGLNAHRETPEERWTRMREWAVRKLKTAS